MVDLTEISGLPIKLDEQTGALYFDECIECETNRHVELVEIIPVLLNKYLKYPEIVYRHHKKVKDKNKAYKEDGLRYDILSIPYGLLGIEYIRTHVYFSEYQKDKFDSVVEVLSGSVTVVMQKNAENDDPYAFEKYVEEIVLVRLEKGQKFAIPTGVYYTFVNTEMFPAVVAKVAGHNHKEIDYSILSKERGLAYYIISKNARLEVVANPKYKVLNKPRECTREELLNRNEFVVSGFNLEELPLYNLLKNKHDNLRAVIIV